MSIIAFCIVFIVCAGLMAMMYALKAFATAVDDSAKAKEQAKAPIASPASSASATPTAQAVAQSSSDDDELAAVIMAAISAACGAGARVVSFTQAPPKTAGSAWRMTGRLQNSEGFGD